MDNKVINLEARPSIQAQASNWLAKLDGSDPSEAELQAFRRWVNESPAHIAAFEEVAKAWDDLNILVHLPVLNQQRHAGETQRSAAPTAAGYNTATGPAAALKRPAFSTWAVAATLLVVTLLGWQNSGFFSPESSHYTAVGEQKTVTLSDGSVVQLNTQSRIDIVYSEQARAIYLHQGEAHFEVVKDPARPFDVYVASSRVRAIGTAFTVALAPTGGDIGVLVAEGIVEIEPELAAPRLASQPLSSPLGSSDNTSPNASTTAAVPTKPEAKAQRLKAGEAATLNNASVQYIETVAAEELQRRLAWQQGLLVFSGEPLQQVLAEISRYTDTKIILKSEQAKDLRIGGQFKVGDTHGIIKALEQGFGLQADFVTAKLVYISHQGALPQGQ